MSEFPRSSKWDQDESNGQDSFYRFAIKLNDHHGSNPAEKVEYFRGKTLTEFTHGPLSDKAKYEATHPVVHGTPRRLASPSTLGRSPSDLSISRVQ